MAYRNLDARRENQREYYKRVYTENRAACLRILTPVCGRCGFLDIRVLNIDHVNGGGTQEAKIYGGSYYKKIRKKLEAGSNDYQVLCANCNGIKRIENNEDLGLRNRVVVNSPSS